MRRERRIGLDGEKPVWSQPRQQVAGCEASARSDLKDRTHRAVTTVCDGSVEFRRISQPCSLITRSIVAENGASDRQR